MIFIKNIVVLNIVVDVYTYLLFLREKLFGNEGDPLENSFLVKFLLVQVTFMSLHFLFYFI